MSAPRFVVRTITSQVRRVRESYAVIDTATNATLDHYHSKRAADGHARQLNAAHAPKTGRPTLGRAARRSLTIRIDPDVLALIKQQADARGIGYQSLMHEYLASGAKGGAR